MPGTLSFKQTQFNSSPRSQQLTRNDSTVTFSPKFVNSLASKDRGSSHSSDSARDLAEFSGKRWVWLKDDKQAFVKGWVVSENGSQLTVRCDNENVDRVVDAQVVDKVNPPKFNLVEDMADLTYLNEASVIHNLRQRYENDFIYTYSGLFLVTVNPYRNLPIYGADYVDLYKEKRRGDTKPHIFATSDIAFHDMLEMRENQSILITGESGAGKTENTKKVIQYLAAIASGPQSTDNLEQQILQANPILEAFGNAQTVRNNNSSRFGKFIRIEFDPDGNIAGANIEWYLLEKSRVVFQRSDERNYHVFYQLIRGADKPLKDSLLLNDGLDSYRYLASSRKSVQGIDDIRDFSALKSALKIMGFKAEEMMNLWKTIASILHLGNITIAHDGTDQARIPDPAQAEIACHLLGIPSDSFIKALLTPRVRAGREWVTQSRNREQVYHSLDALSKTLYERCFGWLVERINVSMERSSIKSSFIGVLDIAGFEIFKTNSFEQLCINYTNEKLQQFFNHHMFVLEQEEYAREDIEWKFIDFGHDLQPTIDLIEKSNPIGLMSLLDEECIMPKGSDQTFTSKVYDLWDSKSKQFKPSRNRAEGFILTHYAADVEYSTEDWLSKNRDPLNDNITSLLSNSTDPHIASLFEDLSHSDTSRRVKKGIFRTVAQRHKEQLSSLMTQLNSTQPHFVRCIIPNERKQPRVFNGPLVLDQLRCNGVLEGIRIARTGFPNRLTFTEFRQRYEVLMSDGLPKGFIESRNAAQMILASLDLDKSMYQMGRTKVFFRAGLLAELEEQRDRYMQNLFTMFQSSVRGYMQRRLARKRLYRHEAIGVLQQNLIALKSLQANPWWMLYTKMKPLLTASRAAEEEKAKKAAMAEMAAKIAEEKKHAQRLEDDRRRVEAEKAKIQEQLLAERALAADTQEILRRSKEREQEMQDQLESFMAELEEADNNYDKLMDGFAESQRTVERMRAELNLGAQLVQKLQDEKLHLMEELDEVSRDNEQRAQNEDQALRIRELEENTVSLKGEIKKLQIDLRDRRQAITGLEREIDDMEKDIGRLEQEKLKAQNRTRLLENELRVTKAQVDELVSTNLDNEKVIRMKDSQIAMLQENLQQRNAKDSFKDSRDYQTVLDSNQLLERELEEYKLAVTEAHEARLKAEQIRKTAQDQLHVLRQEAEIQREDLRSAEAETKKAWKIVAEANSKNAAQAKELKEVQDSKIESYSKAAALERDLDELRTSTKFGNVEKSRLETEIVTLQRRLKMEQELTRAVEAELAVKNKEIGEAKLQERQASNAKLAAAAHQNEKFESTIKDWQNRYAQVASKLDTVEAQKSRAALEIEDLNHELARSTQIGTAAERMAMNLKNLLSEAQASSQEAKSQLSALEQENNRLRQDLTSITRDLDERTEQLLLLQRSVGILPPSTTSSSPGDWKALKAKTLQNVDLAKRLEEANLALQVMEEARASLERRLQNATNWKDEFDQPSRPQWRTMDDVARSRSRESSPFRSAVPSRLRERTGSVSSFMSATTRSEDSSGSDDLTQRKYAQSLRNEIEELTTKLELSEMQRRRLEVRGSPGPSHSRSHSRQDSADVESLELRRLQRENTRLHELVDEQAEKLASSEGSKPRSSQVQMSTQRLEQDIKALEHTKQKLTEQNNSSLRELTKCRAELDKALASNQTTERQVKSLKQQLETEQSARQAEQKSHQQSMTELKSLKIRMETLSGKYAEMEDTLKMHRARSEDLQDKLEEAEIAAHNAIRSESYARDQLQEVEASLAAALNEQRRAEDTIVSLQRELSTLEGKLEDNAAELKSAKNRCQRLEHDLQDLQTHQDYEVKERSVTLEQTRSKYHRELESLTKELEDERNSAVNVHAENRQLRAELESIQAKFNDDRASGSNWAKEKSRMETQYRLLTESFEEAVVTNREAQSQQVTLLSQNRSLRASLEEAEAVRTELLREKLALENKLQNLNESDLFSHETNPDRHPGILEKKIVDLKSELAEKHDAAAAAIEKMRRAEKIAADAQKEIAAERQSIVQLHKDKAMLEKSVNDLRMKLVDLETRSYRGGSGEGSFLPKRIRELEKELQDRERELSDKSRTDRNLEREIKSLESEIAQKEKTRVRLEQDLQRSEEKNIKLKHVIDEMMNENTTPGKLGRFASTRSGR